ncbi:MAG: hypothetical protein HQ518_20840 [Rhodopirellula sp.]|nr:hypothetical protein [Rhodopirellula sp.]
MLSVLVLTSMLATQSADIDTAAGDSPAFPFVAPELLFSQPFSAMEIDSKPLVALNQGVVRGQGPGAVYDEDPVQANLGNKQFLGPPPMQHASQWNPMAPVWPGTPLIDPNGLGAPFASVPGLNGPRPFQYGWTRKLNVGYLSKEKTNSAGGGAAGDFGVFEVNSEIRYTAPLPTLWIASFAPQFNLRNWNGPVSPDLPADVYRFGLDLQLITPTVGPFTAELGFNPSLNTDFNQSPGSDAWNWDGRGAINVTVNPQTMVVLGALFWDRVDDRVLPYGGVVFKPNEYFEIRALFPRSEVSIGLGTPWGIPQWLYVNGEYHVEAYEIGGGGGRQIQLQDWRAMLGIRSDSCGVESFLEGGWVFDRQVKFSTGGGNFDIASGFIARFGIKF